MIRVFLDTNVFVYALGREHRYRGACREIVDRLRIGELRGESSVEVLGEFLHVRGGRGEASYAEAVERTREIARMVEAVHDLRLADLSRALQLLESGASMRPSDALHAATALNHGLEVIVTADRHFDAVSGLRRVDPLDRDALQALLDD